MDLLRPRIYCPRIASYPTRWTPKKTGSTETASHLSVSMSGSVQEPLGGTLLAVPIGGNTIALVPVADREAEEAEWWEQVPVFSIHYRATSEDGRDLRVYRKLETASWRRNDGYLSGKCMWPSWL